MAADGTSPFDSGAAATDRSPLKSALIAIRDLKSQVADLRSAHRQPIAVVGVGCRFPGGVVDAATFWRVVSSGTDVTREVSCDRWLISEWPEAPSRGGFLDGLDQFDPGFFGLEDAEAAQMDPAQRLLLETSWRALEDAGARPDRLAGTPVGVYTGLALSDYGRRHFLGENPERLTAWSGTGALLSAAAGRIAYTLGLQGPAMVVDTACSSGLVAVHLAIQALRDGSVSMALAGAANVILSPMPSVAFARLGALSADGRCKTFGAAADGYGRGEGAGVVVLKRLEDALADGDRIRAVIRGSSVNQDGTSNGFTAPSGLRQQAVVRAALADAGCSAEEIGAIEAHGTGTPLGDPIELAALRSVFGHSRQLSVGTVKTCFAHTESAAGIAGLIKAVLSVEAGELAPHPVPDLIDATAGFTLSGRLAPWPADLPRRIGVSSFGLTGTNAHVIVEVAPEGAAVVPVSVNRFFGVSAGSRAALVRLVEQTAAQIAEPVDVWTAECRRRAELPWRVAVTGRDAAGLAEALQGADPRRVQPGGMAWVFAGEVDAMPGGWPDHSSVDPVIQDVLRRVASVVPGLAEAWTTETIGESRYALPGLLALQVGCAHALVARGAEPAVVLGHGVGEFAVAVLAGVFELEAAAELVAELGSLWGDGEGQRGWLQVDEPLGRAATWPEGVTLAAVDEVNGHVLTGHPEQLESLADVLQARGVACRRLQGGPVSLHATSADERAAWRARVESTTRSVPTLPWISGRDGEPVGARATDVAYWVDGLLEPVRFADVWPALGPIHTVLQVGPGASLLVAAGRERPDVQLLAVGRGGPGDSGSLESVLAEMWVTGDLSIDEPRTSARAPMPHTPFDRHRCWAEPNPESMDLGARRIDWTPQPAPSGGQPSGVWWVLGEATHPVCAELRGAGLSVRVLAGLEELSDVVESERGVDHVLCLMELDGRSRSRQGLLAALWILQHTEAVLHVAVEWSRPSGLPGLVSSVRSGSPHRIGCVLWDGTASSWLDDLGAGTPEVRWVDAVRQIPNLRPVEPGSAPVLPGVVWITGASGVLGRALAAHLAPRVQTLVLISRSGLDVETVAELGPHVRDVRGDVTDSLVPLASEFPPDLVFHLAGAVTETDWRTASPADLEIAFEAKVDGAWRLNEAAPDAAIVVVGSAAAILGNPGQPLYAAANAWLEGFARWRGSLGAPTWCVAPGPIAGTPSVEGREAVLAARGANLLSIDAAVRGLVQVRGTTHPTTLLVPFDWARWDGEEGASQDVGVAVDGVLRELLGSIDPARPFFEAGLDSLMAVEVARRLSKSLRREVPVSLLFDASTRDALVAVLDGQLAPAPVLRGDAGAAVAIVGMVVRLPGAATLADYWTLLDEGRDAVGPIDRWPLASVVAPDPATPGHHSAREAGLIDDPAAFDAARFGISPREAERIDPQQRWVLEASADLLETSTETSVGVFVGIGRSRYGARFDTMGASQSDPYAGLGNESSFAAGRISHALGLRGPAMAVDTACSSALVAIHLAVGALRRGECATAVAGGVHALVGPESTVELSQLRVLSATDRCRTFSADADGYVRAEGAAVVLLKPLADAERDGDRIHAVIRGTAVGHDGRASGLTVPDGGAQREVVARALMDAGIDGADIDLIEAHGTGTRLGDPIEVDALRGVLLEGRPADRPVWLGSVKTNIGHTEAAAGGAGLIKAALALQHQRVPAHLHAETPNPEIRMAGFRIPARSTDAPLRFVGVSSFGISGTNAHVVLERAPERPSAPKPAPRAHLLSVFSGSTSESASKRAAFTTGAGGAHSLLRMRRRTFGTYRIGSEAARVPRPTVDGSTAWLFTGQGSQRVGMFEGLQQDPELWSWIQRGLDHLRARGLELLPITRTDAIHRTEHAQPALLLLGHAVARWLQSRGLGPDVVMGHSLGELTAASVAGVWELETALDVVLARAAAMAVIPAGGASVAVFARAAIVTEAIGDEPVDITGFNGPDETVLAGAVDAVERVLKRLPVRHTRLNTSHPFHSRHMAPAVAIFEEALLAFPGALPTIPLVGNLDGREVGRRALDPSYWASLIREPVRFEAGVETLIARSVRTFVEVGPRPILAPMVARLHPDRRTVSTLPREGDPLYALTETLGECWVAGATLDAGAVTGAFHGESLPQLPDVRPEFWVDEASRGELPDSARYRVEWVPQSHVEGGRVDGVIFDGNVADARSSALVAVAEGRRWFAVAHPGNPGLAGFARSFALEHPDSWGGLVQVSAVSDGIGALEQLGGEDEVRWIGGERSVRRLVRDRGEHPVAVHDRGTYLVTGGTGAIGRAVVKRLLERGCQVLVLARRVVDVEGADVHAIDVTDAALVEEWAAGRSIDGIFHCAGVGGVSALAAPDTLDEVWAAKVEGARNLRAALPAVDLWVAVGSVAATWGSAGQTAYAAANDALQGVMADHPNATVVELGPVDGGVAEPAHRRWAASRGLGTLSVEEAAEAIIGRVPVAARVDWERFGPVMSASRSRPLLSGLWSPPALTSGVRDLPMSVVQELAAEVLGLAPAALSVDQGLFDAGMDSVTAVELARALSEVVGRSLPATVVFDHGTVRRLTTHLAGAVERPAADRSSGESIVICGMGMRMPGGMSDPEVWWTWLREGHDAVGPVPVKRWDVSTVPGTPEAAAFLDDVQTFDAGFFGIAPVEAVALDPQQRRLLEVAHEAIERAGLDVVSLRTGVFVGIGESSYLDRFRRADDPRYLDSYEGTGNESSFAAGRIAHALGLGGPVVALNTACSSSLVALHLAAAALRADECDAALAGGVSLMLTADDHLYLHRLGALAPDGRCKTFSASADGYGRGEGAGVVVLMREADARAGGHPILARVLGSAVEHDGAAGGLTVPNGAAQEGVVRAALVRAGIDPSEVTAVEAHGTGTRLGDPIEIAALRRALGPGRRWVSSVKTAIGHLEQAAGVASVIKGVLQLRHGALAPHLHCDTVSPELDLGDLQIPRVAEPWSGVLGISGFGLSGTNAHVLLGPGDEVVDTPLPVRPIRLSAHDRQAVVRLQEALIGPIQQWGRGAISDSIGRRRGRTWRAVDQGAARRARVAPRLAWLFTGQGSVSSGMDARIYASQEAYRAGFDEAAVAFQPHLPGDLRAAMADDRVHQTQWTQPALFCVEWGLACHWRARGLTPDVLLGHSIGELVAAAWAEMADLDEMARLVAVRAAAMAAIDLPGGMAMVGATEDQVRAALVEGLEIAGVNAPGVTVVSGDRGAVEDWMGSVPEAWAARRLSVSHAFHSAHMEPAVAAVDRAAGTISWRAPRIPVVRNLDGLLHSGAPEADYWGRQLRGAVRFSDGLMRLKDARITALLELGPRPVLVGAAMRVDPEWFAVSSLDGNGGGLDDAAAQLWSDGVEVEFDDPVGPVLPLPPTPMSPVRCWIDRPEHAAVPDGLRDVLWGVRWEQASATPVSGPVFEVGARSLSEALPDLLEAARGAGDALTLVTRGAAMWDGEADAHGLSGVSGFVRALQRERPQTRWAYVDVESDCAVQTVVGEPMSVMREGSSWVPRLAAVRASGRLQIREDRAYLVSGGSGGVGASLARWLVERGAGQVLLLSRTPDPDMIRALGGESAGVHGLAADVRDAEAVRGALQGTLPLAGIVHAAAVLQDATLATLDASDAEQVLSVKLDGARVLSELSADLDFLALMSSASSVLGSEGQSMYCAANAALDGFARTLRARGVPAVSIGWGPWASVGMASRLSGTMRDRYAQAGIRLLTASLACAAFERVVASGVDTLILPVDRARFIAARGGPLLTGLGWSARVESPVDQAPIQDMTALEGWIAERARQVLGAPEAPDVHQPLADLGMDSLMAVRLRNALSSGGLDVPIARLLGGPSIEEIAIVARASVAPPVESLDAGDAGGVFRPGVLIVLLALWMLVVGAVLGWTMATVFDGEVPQSELRVAPRAER